MTQSQVTEATLPCPECPSSDAYFLYDDGHGYCYSCGWSYQPNKNKELIDLVEGSSFQYVKNRCISEDVFRFYNVLTKVNAEGEPLEVSFPYREIAAKVRGFKDKSFRSVGNMKDATLFGVERFTPGQNKCITIVEGEYDALATYQMLGGRYPVVSVRSSSTARKDCERERDFLNSFDKIYLCFDRDAPGQDALRECALLFDVNKVYHVKLGAHKDANDYLEANAQGDFLNAWNNARPFMPKDIVASWAEIDKLLNEKEAPNIGDFPFKTLNEMSYGIRSGEYILFTAQEKVGKTEVLRAIEHHLLQTTEHNMGIIHLEEQEKRSVEGLVGYELMAPVHLPDSGFSISDISGAFRSLSKRDGRVHFYSHFGSDDPDIILDIIRYLVTTRHCKFIFLDHITMLVTGFEDDDERRRLDYLSTRFAMMTRELNFTLFLVSHVNDDGKTRGSRNISKVADLIVHMDRDIEGATLDARNKTHLMVRGNRFAGRTGPAGILWFNPETFTLKEMEIADVFEGSSIRDFAQGSGQPLYPGGL